MTDTTSPSAATLYEISLHHTELAHLYRQLAQQHARQLRDERSAVTSGIFGAELSASLELGGVAEALVNLAGEVAMLRKERLEATAHLEERLDALDARLPPLREPGA